MRWELNQGKPFMHIRASSFYPEEEDDKEIVAEYGDPPVFSEMFLYSCMSKGDARFIMAVAEEYANLIALLGTEDVQKTLKGCRDDPRFWYKIQEIMRRKGTLEDDE